MMKGSIELVGFLESNLLVDSWKFLYSFERSQLLGFAKEKDSGNLLVDSMEKQEYKASLIVVW